MSTILFTKNLWEDALQTGDTRSAYMYGLVANGSSTGAVSYTPATGITMYRPFVKSAEYASNTIPHPGKFLAGSAANVTKLMIYSGDRPDISAITGLTAYDSQKLIQFNIPAYNASRAATGMYVEPGSTTAYTGFKAICGICPTLTTAISSGIATWFWFGIALTDTEAKVYNSSYTGNYNNLTGYQFVTGSVGILGSGADLEIADTSVVSGQQYKSFGFNFYIPAVNTIIE